jgi:hypothetical protein
MKTLICVNVLPIEREDVVYHGNNLVLGATYKTSCKEFIDEYGNICYYIDNLGSKLACRFAVVEEPKTKMFVVIRPSMKGTSIPVYNFTFAITADEAILKVRIKWGEYDSDIIAKELSEDEMKILVISTNNFG